MADDRPDGRGTRLFLALVALLLLGGLSYLGVELFRELDVAPVTAGPAR